MAASVVQFSEFTSVRTKRNSLEPARRELDGMLLEKMGDRE